MTWIACGGTILALAFTIHPVHASRWVFWTIIGVGAVALLVSGYVLLHGIVLYRRRSRSADPRRRLLAQECRRLGDALTAFIAECDRARPRPLWTSNANRIEEWRRHTAARYRSELGGWALRVFDDAVACDAAPATARALVRSPAAAQLEMVRDLFGEAAQILERP